MSDWEQLAGEPNAAYSHFLAYRNLGPTRTLENAYRAFRGDQGLSLPGAWSRESVEYRWVDRAAAWDVHTLSEAGARVVTLFVAAMEELALATLHGLRSKSPRTFAEALAGLEALGGLIPAETVEAVQQTAAERRIPAIGGQGPGITIDTESIE